MCHLPYFSVWQNGIYILVWYMRKAQIPRLPPGGLPHRSTLDVWLPTGGRRRGCFEITLFWCRMTRPVQRYVCTLMLRVADCTVCYLAVISSSSTRCLISVVTLSIILTSPRLRPAGWIHENVFFFNIKNKVQTVACI